MWNKEWEYLSFTYFSVLCFNVKKNIYKILTIYSVVLVPVIIIKFTAVRRKITNYFINKNSNKHTYDSSHIYNTKLSCLIFFLRTHNVNQFLSSHLNKRLQIFTFLFVRPCNEPSKQPRMPYPACDLTDV